MQNQKEITRILLDNQENGLTCLCLVNNINPQNPDYEDIIIYLMVDLKKEIRCYVEKRIYTYQDIDKKDRYYINAFSIDNPDCTFKFMLEPEEVGTVHLLFKRVNQQIEKEKVLTDEDKQFLESQPQITMPIDIEKAKKLKSLGWNILKAKAWKHTGREGWVTIEKEGKKRYYSFWEGSTNILLMHYNRIKPNPAWGVTVYSDPEQYFTEDKIDLLAFNLPKWEEQ